MKIVLSTLAVAALLATSAHAADMPVKAPRIAPAVAVSVFNWTGFYLGVQAGYGWGRSKHCDHATAPFECGPPGEIFPDFKIRGWVAGGTIGYNHQVGNVVLGVEADGSWANIKGQSADTADFGCNDFCITKIKSFGTVRGRVGYAFDRFLPYVTGGVAFTRLNSGSGSTPFIENTTTKTTAVVGGGAEYAITNNWSAKAEYIYVFRLGDNEYDLIGECSGPPGCFSRDSGYGVLRGGLNYRFGAPAPVVARY